MRAQEAGNMRFLVARNKHADLLLCKRVSIDLDIVEKVLPVEDVAAVTDAVKCLASKPTTSVALRISETEVVVRRRSLGDCQDGDGTRDDGDFECRGWGLHDLVVLEDLCRLLVY